MKTMTIAEKLAIATNMEEIVYVLHREFDSIPVRVSHEPWDGFEIRITESKSTCYSPVRWRINAADIELIERLAAAFQHIDYTMFRILNKVWAHDHLGTHFGFMEELDIDEMLRRWERFNKWVGKYYPDYNEEPLHRKVGWDDHKSLPANSIAWAARVILFGIKPSDVGLKLFKEHKVEITEAGLLMLTEESGLVSRWHFSDAKGAVNTIDSFGLGGCFDAAMQKAFGDDKDIVECNKIPEQWEIEANVFVGLKPEKKGLFK